MRKYLNRQFNKWMLNRQIHVCGDILSRHSAYLGPEHEKEVRAIYSRLVAERGNLYS